jgi:hypothetical protein
MQSNNRQRKPFDCVTWSPFQSPEVLEICAHLTDAERNILARRGALNGVWLFVVPFIAMFAAIQSGKAGFMVLLLGALAAFYATFVVITQQRNRAFLCSTDWARKQGMTPEELRLFSFGSRPVKASANRPDPSTGRVAGAQPESGGRGTGDEMLSDSLLTSAAVRSSRRPWPLRIVAALFILTGCVAAWDIGSNFHNHVYSANISLLGLSVGIGLLRLRSRWRIAGLIMIWLPFILGACLGMAALFGQFTVLNHATFFGFELTGLPRFLATIAACTLIPILLMWMSRVLTHSEVKALFQHASSDRPWLEWAALPAAVMIASVLSNLTGPSGSAQSRTANPLPEGSSAATFGPVIERVIPDPAEGTACVLDFETGNLLEPPAEVVRALSNDVSTFDPTVLRWLRDNGDDAAVVPDGSIQLFEGVVLNPTVKRHATTWEELAPNVVASGIEGMSEEERKPSIHQPAFHFVTLRYPAAMEFTTRERSMGVLQILGAADNPHGVKIRYRLVRDSKTNVAPTKSHAPAAEQPEATLGPAFGREQEFRRLLAESVPVK